MTLAEIAELVCTKVHRTDAESVAEAKVSIRARYKMIWDSRPWKDTLGLMTIAASDDRTLILPIAVSRVLALRWSTSVLDPDQLITIFMTDSTRFDEISNPISYSMISPSGVEVSPAGARVQLFSDASDASFSVSIHGLLGNVDTRETVAIAGASTHNSTNSYDEIISLAKTNLTNGLTVKNYTTGDTILTLPAKEAFRQYQRVLFHSTPTEEEETFLIYKRRCNDLTSDSDATEIFCIDNALVAFAIADMHEAQRQFTKATAKAAEAGVLIQAAADNETHQQANVIRIIPWDFNVTSLDDSSIKQGYL